MFKQTYLKSGPHRFPYQYGVFKMGRLDTACVLVPDPWVDINLKQRAAEVAMATYDKHLKALVPLESVIWFETDWYQSIVQWRAERLDDAALRQRYKCEVPEGARTIREIGFRVATKGFFRKRQVLQDAEREPYHGSPEKLEAIMAELELVIGDVRKSIKV
jgi:hypothetical protein